MMIKIIDIETFFSSDNFKKYGYIDYHFKCGYGESGGCCSKYGYGYGYGYGNDKDHGMIDGKSKYKED